MNQDICDFCDCLKKAARNKYHDYDRKFSVALVEEYYDKSENFKGQARYGGFELNFCPCCGRKLTFKNNKSEESMRKELFRYKG